MLEDDNTAANDSTAVQVPTVPEQAASTESKQDEKTESTTTEEEASSSFAVTMDDGTWEKRKRETTNRRFSRFFRTASPKKSPPKKARTERRRSTGSSERRRPMKDEVLQLETSSEEDIVLPVVVSQTTASRNLPFLRRNASLGNDDTTNRAMVARRRRSLFRRGRPQRPSTDPLATSHQEDQIKNNNNNDMAPWRDQTRVITVRKNTRSPKVEEEKKEDEENLTSDQNESSLTNTLCASTEIFQHSYLETLCGVKGHADDSSVHEEEETSYQNMRRIPDDPTVQESIECVFSNTLEEDISRMLQLDDDDDDDNDSDGIDEDMLDDTPLAPSQIQQSVMKTRSDISRTTPPQTRSRKRVESIKLAHVGSFRSGSAAALSNQALYPEPPITSVSSGPARISYSPTCPCKCQQKPALDPSQWPQAPLLLRPTPGRGTKIQRIRLVRNENNDDGSTILWEAGQTSKRTWSQALKEYWGQKDDSSLDCDMCPECVILPINNGNEERGETLVTDFESDLFVGTLMLRLRYCHGTTRLPYQDDRGYFTGMNRRYQAVIRGRFKKELSWTQCKTGFVFDRPAGKLPAKWILKGAVKVLSFFAPHLEVKFDGPRPMSMTPLGSTPQVLAVHNPDEPYDIEVAQEEPTKKEHTLLGEASMASSSLQRAKQRKKAFDKIYANQAPLPKTDPSKVYTFEFLQHLFDFQEFSMELGSMLGSVPLAPILDGQALPIMASHADHDQRLWSFDVWHHSLVTGKGK